MKRAWNFPVRNSVSPEPGKGLGFASRPSSKYQRCGEVSQIGHRLCWPLQYKTSSRFWMVAICQLDHFALSLGIGAGARVCQSSAKRIQKIPKDDSWKSTVKGCNLCMVSACAPPFFTSQTSMEQNCFGLWAQIQLEKRFGLPLLQGGPCRHCTCACQSAGRFASTRTRCCGHLWMQRNSCCTMTSFLLPALKSQDRLQILSFNHSHNYSLLDGICFRPYPVPRVPQAIPKCCSQRRRRAQFGTSPLHMTKASKART